MAFQTQLRSLPTLGDSFISGTTSNGQHPAKKTRAKERLKISKLTVVVSANLESLVSAHNQASFAVLLVLQQPHVASATFLPFLGLAVESEELGTHLEDLLLEFFVGLHIDLLRKVDDWLEVNFRRIGGLFLLWRTSGV